MDRIKGGWSMDRVAYQPAVVRFTQRLMLERRLLLLLPDDAERGCRFNSDDAVMARIESNYTEEEFMACPGLAVDAMLADAAKSDYWYSHEKEYYDNWADQAEDPEDGE